RSSRADGGNPSRARILARAGVPDPGRTGWRDRSGDPGRTQSLGARGQGPGRRPERPLSSRAPVVFLLDVDNTLLDNDAVAADLKGFLTLEVGEERQKRYWAFFEELRAELGYADYLGA